MDPVDSQSIIYLDNAATTFPKPEAVYRAADEFYRRYGGNAGRGGNPLAKACARLLAATREQAAAWLHACAATGCAVTPWPRTTRPCSVGCGVSTASPWEENWPRSAAEGADPGPLRIAVLFLCPPQDLGIASGLGVASARASAPGVFPSVVIARPLGWKIRGSQRPTWTPAKTCRKAFVPASSSSPMARA